MILDFPLWPAVEFDQPPELMSVAEIEEFAPLIPCELTDEEIPTLEAAFSVPGGMAIYCHRERLQNEKNGLTAIPTKRRTP